MEKVPIYIKGESAGELSISQNGLMTRFCAKSTDAGELVRLHVFGGARSAYLGVMQPDGKGGLSLERSLTKNALRALPPRIEYAADRERGRGEERAPEKDEACEAELLWFSTPEGVLTAFDGTDSLIAIPADKMRGAPVPQRIIAGRRYAIFPGKRNL